MKPKVIFLDEIHDHLRERLIELGYECILDFNCSREELKKTISDYTGIVIRSRIKLDEKILSGAKKLKFIARSGAGMENIDNSFTDSHEIICFNAPEGNRTAVAEHVLGMLLALFNNIPDSIDQVKKGVWDREGNRGVEIEGKTIGIIGHGNTGGALSRRLRGFDCQILTYDKYNKIDHDWVRQVGLEELQDNADIISFHVPLTDETKYYFDEDFINRCKKEIFLINAARGSVVSNQALVNGIKSGKVQGACLDVLENEKFSFENIKNVDSDLEFLLNHDKVIITPHVAGWTKESYFKLSKVLADKIESHFH